MFFFFFFFALSGGEVGIWAVNGVKLKGEQSACCCSGYLASGAQPLAARERPFTPSGLINYTAGAQTLPGTDCTRAALPAAEHLLSLLTHFLFKVALSISVHWNGLAATDYAGVKVESLRLEIKTTFLAAAVE